VFAATLGATPSQNDALGRWLPNVVPNFVPWGQAKASYGGKFDSFRCGSGLPITTKAQEFDFAIGTCRSLQDGTPLNFGSGEPQRGRVLYDPAHRIALYYVGCCAGRTYVLAADVARPPSSVRSADLRAVGTARGAALGMTMSDVIRAYGKATPYTASSGGSVVPVISYTTFSSNPVRSNEAACGQYQTFSFKNKKVIIVQIYVGC
jgi:hypothetical protein